MAERTLLDIMDESANPTQAMLIKSIVDTSDFYRVAPILNKPAGISTFDQENVLPDPSHRNYNANYTGSAFAPQQKVKIELQPFGDVITIDRKLKKFYEAQNGTSYVNAQLEKYGIAIGLNFKKEFIRNTAYGLRSWAQKYDDAGFNVFIDANGGTPVTMTSITVTALLDAFNEAVNEGAGVSNLYILANQALLNRLQSKTLSGNNSALADYFTFETVTDPLGRTQRTRAMFNGIPIIAMGKDSQRSEVILSNYGAGTDETEIYFVNLSNDQTSVIQDAALEVEEVSDNGVLKSIIFDWAVAAQVAAPDAIRVVRKIKPR